MGSSYFRLALSNGFLRHSWGSLHWAPDCISWKIASNDRKGGHYGVGTVPFHNVQCGGPRDDVMHFGCSSVRLSQAHRQFRVLEPWQGGGHSVLIESAS